MENKRSSSVLLNNILKEGNAARDTYLNGGSYTPENTKGLMAMLFDERNNIDKGQFVTLKYVSSSDINKTFNNGDYTDKDGTVMTRDDIISNGRSFNKKYMNNFYDSDAFPKTLGKARGPKLPYALLTVSTINVNWAVDKYGEQKNKLDNAFNNASDSDIDYYASNDPSFQKRKIQFVYDHPEYKDEISRYDSEGGMPRDVFNQIRATKIQNNGGGWTPKDGNPYVWTRTNKDGTTSDALRITVNKNIPYLRTDYYAIVDGTIYSVPKKEYYHWKKAFRKGGATHETDNTNEFMNQLKSINSEFDFRNYLLPSIASLNFSVNGKKIQYINRELTLPDTNITIDANELENAPETI
jgi:hypothetical protein